MLSQSLVWLGNCIVGCVTMTDSERFWKSVERTEKCWNWTGFRDNNGYGQISINGNAISVHRFSWELHFFPIPKGLLVCHACDNPSCVNPNHLWLGTVTANNLDRARKGRSRTGPLSATTRIRMSLVRKGKKKSEEHKRRLSQSMKKRALRV